MPVGAKVLAGSSAAEPGEPGGEAIDGAAAEDAANGSVEAKGDRRGGRGKGGVAAGRPRTEIVPHFPHIGRVARYSQVPVSVAGGVASPSLSRYLPLPPPTPSLSACLSLRVAGRVGCVQYSRSTTDDSVVYRGLAESPRPPGKGEAP